MAHVSQMGAKWLITDFWSTLTDRDSKADSEYWQSKTARGMF